MMKALVLNELHRAPDYQDTAMPEPGPGESLVQIKAAAMNHRDLYITKGQYAGIEMPCILGSDGAGISAGKEVIIFPSLDWGDDARAQGKQFRVLGMPDHGTFGEFFKGPATHLYPKPRHLSWQEAAALPLAGLTAWRTLFTRCGCKEGDRVLITGIGGGVALMALQFALAAGAEVFVSSGSAVKIEKAMALGAQGGVLYTETGWDKSLKQQAGGFDIVIDSAGGPGFALLPGLCHPGGRIGIYGGSLGKIDGISPQILFWKQLSILGSTMGDQHDFEAMLDFVDKHQIKPVVDKVFKLSEAAQAFERMASGAQFGKIVFSM